MEQKIKSEIINEAKRIGEDALNSSKSHFICAAFWRNIHYGLGLPAAIFTALAGTNSIAQQQNSYLATAVLSLIATILIGVLTFLNPQEKANRHHNAGNDYSSLKNDARIFSSIDIKEKSIQEHECKVQLKELSTRRAELNRKSPQPFEWAYKKAKKAIIAGEADYAVDDKQ